jgi:hypothetical protein
MRRLILTTAITFFFYVQARSVGVRAGADLATTKASFDEISVSDNETGFYIGIFTKFSISDSFKIRPEVNYISIKDLDQIQVPVLAEIGLSEKFHLFAGPRFGFY